MAVVGLGSAVSPSRVAKPQKVLIFLFKSRKNSERSGQNTVKTGKNTES